MNVLCLFIFLFIWESPALGRKFDLRMVGGNYTPIEIVPYLVSLQLKGEHYEGGAIIDETHIVTVASPFTGKTPNELTVRVGSTTQGTGGQVFNVASIYLHPQFNESAKPFDYDIAVLKLSKPLSYGSTVSPIRLPDINEVWPVGTAAFVAGWGWGKNATVSLLLQGITVNTVDHRRCKAMLADFGQVNDRMLCTESGTGYFSVFDHGSPVVVGITVIGLASWEKETSTGYPQVSANVAVLRPFIDEILKLG